jgi:UPF0755 protein
MAQPPRKKATPQKATSSTAKPKAKRKAAVASKRPAAQAGAHRFPWVRGLAVVFVLLLGLMVWQALFRPMNMSASNKVMQVKQGQTYSGLINFLGQHDVVRFPIIIKAYRALFIHNTLKAGAFELPAGINAYQLLNLVNKGELAQMNRVQLIEGTTFAQLKQRLVANTDVKNTVLASDNAQILAAAGIQEAHPEGWFAPDTYFFSQGESDVVVLKQLYEKQKKILNSEWQKRATDLPYHNMYEALIMASIVEKETGLDSERAEVAAVFINRLKLGMRLQTDPTVIYGMGASYDGNITRKDLETPTAYNTYTINGLPPTPIAMPGIAAIHAALHPANTDAIYFVATGTGGHKFSSTLEEHNAAVQKYLQVMRAKRATES